MTVSLKDHGIRGGWEYAVCEGCGKKRSCQPSPVYAYGEVDDIFYFCVLCIVKDIERSNEAEEQQYEDWMAAEAAAEMLGV